MHASALESSFIQIKRLVLAFDALIETSLICRLNNCDLTVFCIHCFILQHALIVFVFSCGHREIM